MRAKGRLEILRKCGRKVHWTWSVWPLLQRGVLVADGLLVCHIDCTAAGPGIPRNKGLNGLPAGPADSCRAHVSDIPHKVPHYLNQ